jgi:hypothetical protein
MSVVETIVELLLDIRYWVLPKLGESRRERRQAKRTTPSELPSSNLSEADMQAAREREQERRAS